MEMAKIIGISKNKLVELANKGLVPALRLPSGHYRFDPQEVIDTLRTKAKVGDNDA
jgi:predicted site-specific integrase-resolvase